MKFASSFRLQTINCLQTATAATTLTTSGIGGDGSNILNAANLQAGTSQGAKGGLGTGTGGLGTSTTGGAKLDVDGGDAELLAADGDVLGGKHRSVRRGLITIGLDLHAAGDTDESFATGDIGDVDESIVKRGEDVADAEDFFTLTGGGAEADLFSCFGSHGLRLG